MVKKHKLASQGNQSTLFKKLVIAITGLFLCFFLVIHLLGNLQLLLPIVEAREKFNWYSQLLSANLFIKIISYFMYISIIAHAIYAVIITVKNNKANGGKYVFDKRAQVSSWNSRNMGILGTIILLFLIIHFKDYWYVYKFGALPIDGKGNKDLYAIVVSSFQQAWYIIIYEISFLALGFHLLHGFASATRTLGLFHPKFAKVVSVFGWIYSVLITLGFMVIPLYIYFNLNS